MVQIDVAEGPRLPRPPGPVRRFLRRHPRAVDAVLMVVLGGVTALAAATTPELPSLLKRVVVLVAVVAAIAGLAWRRHRPWIFLATLVPIVVTTVLTTAGTLLLLFGAYNLTRYDASRRPWWAVAGLAGVLTLTSAVRDGLERPWDPGGIGVGSVQGGLVLLLAALIGTTTRNRRHYIDALIDRAYQLARERDQQAQLSAQAERALIAREMHDIVAHSVTVMVRLAEGAAATMRAEDPEGAKTHERVAEIGRHAMTDMRRILGLLSDGQDSASLAPQPSVEDLPALIEDFRAIGAPVTLAIRGTVPADPALQLTLYRIVQEGLTNAVRYARNATTIHVDIDATVPSTLTVDVTDDGLPGSSSRSQGAHRGLLGARERAAALDGDVTYGPRVDAPQGWRLRAVLPTEEGPRP